MNLYSINTGYFKLDGGAMFGVVPKSIWSSRYEHINMFEKLQTEENTVIVKFFLDISKDEQKRRLMVWVGTGQYAK